jgi:septum formation protein
MLILASQSPRRSEILESASIPFQTRPANVDESLLPNETAWDYVARLAEAKALAARRDAAETVLGADTTVVLDGHILGKPEDSEDAARMLRLLSGRRHEVITGICLLRGGSMINDTAVTLVWFCNLSDREIEDYVQSGEPMDKAGAYAIQGLASKFVEKIDGCYFNVVGLPVALVYQRLKDLPPL